jgi:ribosome-associated protein
MIRVTSTICLSDDELEITFVRSSGPGGQNVNKVATAAQLRFNVARSPSLSAEVRGRLIQLAGRRVDSTGVLAIDARRHRSQSMNRQDAIDRLADLIRRAAVAPRKRRKTAPTRGSKQRRIETKKRHSRDKSLRRGDWE